MAEWCPYDGYAFQPAACTRGTTISIGNTPVPCPLCGTPNAWNGPVDWLKDSITTTTEPNDITFGQPLPPPPVIYDPPVEEPPPPGYGPPNTVPDPPLSPEPPDPGPPIVVLDQVGTDQFTSGAQPSLAYYGFVVGNEFNRLLLAWLVTSSAVSGVAAVWGDQPMDLVASVYTSRGNLYAYMFQLVSPAPGDLGLLFDWVGSASAVAFAVSWNDVDQTNPLYNVVTGSDDSPSGSTPITITVPGVNTYDVALSFMDCTDVALNTVNQTQLLLDVPNGVAANYANGPGADVSLVGNTSKKDNWIIIGAAIKAG